MLNVDGSTVRERRDGYDVGDDGLLPSASVEKYARDPTTMKRATLFILRRILVEVVVVERT